jgi:hypothetical protein
MRLRAVVMGILFLAVLASPLATGYQSGKHNSAGGCSCHYGGSGQVTPSFSGLPTNYVPGQAYSVGISGTGGPSGTEGGFSMTANKGAWSNPGSSVKISSLSVTHSNTNQRSWTVTWTAPSQGSGTTTFNVAVNNVNGNGANTGDGYGVRSQQVPEQQGGNNPPSASNLQLSPANPTALTNLSLSYTFNDPDGDTESGSDITWYRGGTEISANAGQTTITVAKGEEWVVDLTPSDGTDDGPTVSAGPITIGNAAPVAQSVQLFPVDADETDVLSISYNYLDADSDGESGTLVRWSLGGSWVNELENQTTVSPLMTRSGDTWMIYITPSDGEDSGAEIASNLVILGDSNLPPTCTSLSIAPSNPLTTDGLVPSWNYADDNSAAPVDKEIEWHRDGSHEPALDGQWVLPSNATVKAEDWQFRMRASDGVSWSNWVMSNAVTVANSAPVGSIVSIQPAAAISSDDLILAYVFGDADGDAESGTSLLWYRNGLLMTAYSGQTTVPASGTARGETWMARYTPNDGAGFGSQVQTDGVVIGNSPALVDVNSLPIDATSIEPLVLNLSSSDADGDAIITEIHWIRDGFEVGALANLSVIPTEWLAVGQMWSVEVQLADGVEMSSTSYSNVITLVNLEPVAAFGTSSVILVEAQTMLDASASVDLDGGIVAYIWNVGGTRHTGEVISVVLTDPLTVVNLTVVDVDGGQHSIEQTLESEWGETVSALSATVESGEVRLDWTWEGGDTQFTVWRTHEALMHSSRLSGLVPVATTNDSQWSEPIHLAGTYHYTVTVDIAEVHNPRISSNAVTISLDVEDMQEIEPEAEAEAGPGTTFIPIMLFLVLFATLATAMFDRYMGRRS